jgi:hypothetical protein
MPQLPSGLSTKPESFAPAGESNLRLQRAIESLALNLDDELNRYRRSRAGVVPPTPARLPLRQTRKPIDLIALKTAAIAGAKPAAPPPPPNARLQELLGQPSVPTVQAYPPKTAINQVRLSHGGTLTTYRAAPDDYMESSEALLGSLPKGAPAPDDTEYEPSLLRQLTTPLGMGALLLLLVGSASFGYLVTSPQAVSHLTDNPITRRLKGTSTPDSLPSDDPLATQALGDQPDAGQPNAGFKPIGPDLSDQEFASLDLNRISTLPSDSSSATSRSFPAQGEVTGTPRPANGSAAAPPLGSATTSTAVGSEALRTAVVTAPARPAGSQTTTQPSAVTPQPSRAAASSAPAARPPAAMPEAPRPAPAQPPQPIAVNRTPPALATPPAPLTAPAPAARPAPVAPPAPLTQAPPQAPSTYYVVTDYSGAQSLESARSAVGDAYVRNFSSGTRIQMGAFSQPSAAQNLVNQLQGQGIPAQVITP